METGKMKFRAEGKMNKTYESIPKYVNQRGQTEIKPYFSENDISCLEY